MNSHAARLLTVTLALVVTTSTPGAAAPLAGKVAIQPIAPAPAPLPAPAAASAPAPAPVPAPAGDRPEAKKISPVELKEIADLPALLRLPIPLPAGDDGDDDSGQILVAERDPGVLFPHGAMEIARRGRHLFVHAGAPCETRGRLEGDPGAPVGVMQYSTEGLGRRPLFASDEPRADGVCNPHRIVSELIADDDYLYWMTPDALVRVPYVSGEAAYPPPSEDDGSTTLRRLEARLSRDSLPGEEVLEIVSTGVVLGDEDSRAELAQSDAALFVLVRSAGNSFLWQVAKEGGETALVWVRSADAANLLCDGSSVFWSEEESLLSMDASGASSAVWTEHVAAAPISFCSLAVEEGSALDGIHVGVESRVELVVPGGGVEEVYRSDFPQARLAGAARAAGQLHVLERLPLDCAECPDGVDANLLMRVDPDSSATPIFAHVAPWSPEHPDRDLTSDGDALFWMSDDRVMGVPACPDCEPLPVLFERRGDTNVDRAVDISDATVLLAALFHGGEPPACEETADANSDDEVDISDASFLLSYLFLGGPAPDTALVYCGEREAADVADDDPDRRLLKSIPVRRFWVLPGA